MPFSYNSASAEEQNGNPDLCPHAYWVTSQLPFCRSYDVSASTVYRALTQRPAPRVVHRVDQGMPRVLPTEQLEQYCEVIAALKLRTTNKQGRHVSTAEAIRLLEVYGVETPNGFLQAPAAVLKKSTVNRYLKHWGLDWRRLRREPPAVRFQAQ